MQLGYGPVQTLCTAHSQRAVHPQMVNMGLSGSYIAITGVPDGACASVFEPHGSREPQVMSHGLVSKHAT